MRLNAVKFGLAFGIIYGVVFFLYGLVAALFGTGTEMMRMIGKLYLGFGPTILGAVAGAIWGFALGFVFFAFAAWLYNSFLGRS